jgi:hypothetical protein
LLCPSEPSLCSFKRACQDDMGISLQLGSKTFWCRKDSGSTAKSFLLVEASTRCSQVHQILHFLCHFQAHHQETMGYTPLFLLWIGLGSPSPWTTCLVFLQPSMGMTVSSWSLIDSLRWKFWHPARRASQSEATTKLFFTHVWVHFGLPQTIISDRDSRFLSTFWSILWSMMDTKLTKSTSFHPQTDGKTEVVNMMIVHILRMYNSKHPCTWDEILPYVQHSYNRSLHNSIGHNPFQVCLGFQPLAPIDVALPIAATQEESSHAQTKVDRETKFVECIQHIQQQVHDIV